LVGEVERRAYQDVVSDDCIVSVKLSSSQKGYRKIPRLKPNVVLMFVSNGEYKIGQFEDGVTSNLQIENKT